MFTTKGTTPVSGFSKAVERLIIATERYRIERAETAGRKLLAVYGGVAAA